MPFNNSFIVPAKEILRKLKVRYENEAVSKVRKSRKDATAQSKKQLKIKRCDFVSLPGK
jgi:hypothetical protein